MDYRESHKQSGTSYDKNLEEEAISAYMTKLEDALLRTVVPSLFPDSPPFIWILPAAPVVLPELSLLCQHARLA